MKLRPILFSAPMVRALLAGAKTQTRRAVKPQPGAGQTITEYREGDGFCVATDPPSRSVVRDLPCPYGQPGDQLWVRETAAVGHSYDGKARVCYRSDGDVELSPDRKWTPSIFMSRRHSRISLEITNVRVERLQEISESDARSEGISKNQCPDWHAQTDYRVLWESINGPGSWDANPWVWAIEFRRVEQ